MPRIADKILEMMAGGKEIDKLRLIVSEDGFGVSEYLS
jgi:hypothetical protein